MSSTSIDFLFFITNPDLVPLVERVCMESGYRYHLATTPEEVQKTLFADFYKVAWIEIEDEAPEGLQILEWMQTHNFGCDPGIVFHKGHDRQVLRSLILQNKNFLHRQVLSEPAIARKILQRSIQDFEAAQNDCFRVFKRTRKPDLVWVQATQASQSVLQKALGYAKMRRPWVLEGPTGSGKSHLINCVYADVNAQLVWDARSMPNFEQKDHFLKKSPQDHMVWIIQDIGNLDLELQEIVAEFLKGQGWLDHNARIWPEAEVVVTTREPLSDLFEAGKIREDLFRLLYRNVVRFSHLRYRGEDVKAIAEQVLRNLAGDKKPKRLTRDALEILQNYDWPGEVAELESTIALLQEKVAEDWIEIRHLPHDFLEKNIYSVLAEDENLWNLPYQEAKKRTLHKFNRAYMKHLLDDSDQNYTVAAEKAGMDRSNFKKLLKKI